MIPSPSNAPTRSAVAGLVAICCDSRVTPARKHAAAASGRSEQLGIARHERLDELFKRHSAYVARLAYRLMGRDADIDDIVQDVFVLLFRRIDTIRQVDAVPAWLATTTVRLTRRRMRVKRIALVLGFGDRIDMAEIEGASDSPEARAALHAGTRGTSGRERERAHRLGPPLPRGGASGGRRPPVQLFEVRPPSVGSRRPNRS